MPRKIDNSLQKKPAKELNSLAGFSEVVANLAEAHRVRDNDELAQAQDLLPDRIMGLAFLPNSELLELAFEYVHFSDPRRMAVEIEYRAAVKEEILSRMKD